MARAHRELLQAAAAHPVGTEVACCYGLDMQPLSKIIISGQQGRVRIPDQDVPYIAAHTHPSGFTFPPSDIRRFALRENMRMLTAVSNDGTVYEKTAQFDRSGLLALFRDSEIRLAAAEDPKELQEIMSATFEGGKTVWRERLPPEEIAEIESLLGGPAPSPTRLTMRRMPNCSDGKLPPEEFKTRCVRDILKSLGQLPTSNN